MVKYQRTYQCIFICFLSSVLGSCGDDSNPSLADANSSLSGVFIDSPIKGLEYSTESGSGTTDANGGFNYESGDHITFSVGGIVLTQPPTPRNAESIMSPGDLMSLGVPYAGDVSLNVIRFLLTLDDDDMPGNGITIAPIVSEVAQKKTINFNVTSDVFENDGQVQTTVAELTAARTAGPRSLVSRTEAGLHFQSTVATKLTQLRQEMDQLAGLACTTNDQCGVMSIYNASGCPNTYILFSSANTPKLQTIADQVGLSMKLAVDLFTIQQKLLISIPSDQCPPGPIYTASDPVLICQSRQCITQ